MLYRKRVPFKKWLLEPLQIMHFIAHSEAILKGFSLLKVQVMYELKICKFL